MSERSVAEELEAAAVCGLDPDPSNDKPFERRLRNAIADAVQALSTAIERAEAAEKERDHTQYWYAVRIERLKDLAKESGIWPQVAEIIANGTTHSNGYEPPTYAQQLNRAIHRADAAEAELASIRTVLANLLPLIYLENERGIGWRIASEDEDGHTWDGDMLRAAQVALRALRTLEKNV